MYNLLEYNKNYLKTTGSLWNYYRDELTNDTNDNNNFNKNVFNSKSSDKASIIGSTYNVDEKNDAYVANKAGKKDVEIAVPLKHISNFWRTLDMSFTDCEVSLTLSGSENCVITKIDKTVRAAQGNNPAVDKINQESATFQIADIKQYVRVVTLSTEDDNNFPEQLKSGFKRTIKWNKYRPEMTKTKNLNYLIDPTFNKVNRLFVLSFENEEDRTFFSKYYTPKVEIKDFNLLVDAKSFFDVPVKKQRRSIRKSY